MDESKKKGKKGAYKTSEGAAAPQAEQNDEGKPITQADVGTQTEEELVQLKEKEEVVAKVFLPRWKPQRN